MSRVLVLAIPLASACAYAPGSFSSYPTSFPGTRATVGCLDVAASLTGGTVQQGRHPVHRRQSVRPGHHRRLLGRAGALGRGSEPRSADGAV